MAGAARTMTTAARIFTIGFTRSSAQSFFGRLKRAEVSRVVHVRLNNASQLSGFAKKDDLAWFLRELDGISYAHATELAPTPELLSAWRAGEIRWEEYERRFLALMHERRVAERYSIGDLDGACLLCSEPGPEHCHRSLVARHFGLAWGGIDVVHL
jgi:uncharacterized protein (DUF488 family)